MDLDIVDRLLGTTTAEAADVPVQTNEAMPDEVAATANGARLDALASRIAARTPVEPGPRRKGPETEPELSADSPEFRRSA
jgi:hypothetical protein